MFHFLGKRLKLGLIGLGKIAVDQHIPAIRANRGLVLVAGCSPQGRPEGVTAYDTMEEMFAKHPDIEAVAICTPPRVRFELARTAIASGRHVFLEKPPAATLGEAEALKDLASAASLSLLASWHSRFAPGVERARVWISQRKIASVSVQWKENVRQWHPGQPWIFEAGGMGVFDPGINSLSILTHILPERLIVAEAALHIPENCQMPIRAEIDLRLNRSGARVWAEYDFLQQGHQTWDIYVESAAGERLVLSLGGKRLEIDGKLALEEPDAEYPRLYAHFLQLARKKRSDADLEPLRIVADSLLLGRRIAAPAYIE